MFIYEQQQMDFNLTQTLDVILGSNPDQNIQICEISKTN